MNPARGEVWLVELGDPAGRSVARHAVVVSADRLNDSEAGVVIVVPCTTVRRDLPSHVELEPARSGLDEVSYARCEDMMSVAEQRLVDRLGSIGPDTMFEISRVLRYLLDL